MISARLARDSMLPQDSTSTGRPSPRKLSVFHGDTRTDSWKQRQTSSPQITHWGSDAATSHTGSCRRYIGVQHIFTVRDSAGPHCAHQLAMPNQPVTPMTKERVKHVAETARKGFSTSKSRRDTPPASTRRIITASLPDPAGHR